MDWPFQFPYYFMLCVFVNNDTMQCVLKQSIRPNIEQSNV